MTSPTNTGPASGGGAHMNTLPFTTTDPFADDEHGTPANGSSGAENSSHDERRSDSEASSKDRAETKADSDGNAKQTVRFAGETVNKVETHHSTLLEKIKSAADEAAPAVLDRITTAVADKFHIHSIHAHGPSRFFQPTRVNAHIRFKDDDSQNEGTSSARPDLSLLWRSRDNRKNRNSIIVPQKLLSESKSTNLFTYRPDLVSSLKTISQGIKVMFTTFPYWNMAFWSGWSYSVGSALFVVDGAMAWTSVAWPQTENEGESDWGVPFLFLFGAVFYQIGAVIAYLEAVNDGSFHGSAMGKLLHGKDQDTKQLMDEKLHGFFGHLVPHPHMPHPHMPHLHKHRDEEHTESSEKQVDLESGWNTKEKAPRRGLIYPNAQASAPRRGGVDLGEQDSGTAITYFTWRWWPSWHLLRTRHVYEIGFIACTIQLFGVTLYGVTAIVVFPGIIDTLNSWQENAAYWIPQMIAAACFLIASIMFAFETQEKWWKPELKVLGWWIGVWSIVGSVGFELAGAFGPTSQTQVWAEYQSNLSSTWGSFAYLIGSLLQWYEAVNKNPVDEIFNEPGQMKSYMVHPI